MILENLGYLNLNINNKYAKNSENEDNILINVDISSFIVILSSDS